MTVTGAIVLFVVIWFITLLAALPVGVRTQEEDGHVIPGTPSSAPANPRIGRKLLWSTAITIPLWASICAVILWGGLSVSDIDIWHRM
jgi:predicted secreted protein